MNQPTWIQRYKEKFHATYPFENWLYRDMNQKLNYAMIDFIQSELSQQRKEIIEDVEKTVQKELETWARESIGAKAVESVQKALADIITKLSEEK